MAILDSVPGVVVTVCVDGKPLEEYVDESEVLTGRLGQIGRLSRTSRLCGARNSRWCTRFSRIMILNPPLRSA